MIALITILSVLISMLLGFIFGMIFTYIINREVCRGKTVKFLMDDTSFIFAFPGVGLFLSIVGLLVLLLVFIVCCFLKWTKLNLVIKKIDKYINKKSNKILNTKINI